MHALTGAGVTMAGQTREERRDAEFAAYMQARQPSLLRTAYLLSGDRHTAEDLVQTALAKLYLSWDKVQSRDSVDGYVRRILVNENNSLWRRGWKRREHATEVVPDVRAPRGPVRRRARRRAVGRRADPPAQGARRGGAALLRGAERGRDRRGARHLRRHREVPVQPRARRPARASPPDPGPPQPRGGRAMNRPDELERLLGQQLHQQVDGMTDAPIGLGDVKGRAGRIRRNRRIAGGVAVAAVLAVAVPTALLVAPGSQQCRRGAPRPTGPTTTMLTLDGLEVGAAPTIEYFDEQGVVLPVQGVVPLDGELPGADRGPRRRRLAGREPEHGRAGRPDRRLRAHDAARNISQSLVTTPDRDKVAFVYAETGAQTLIVARPERLRGRSDLGPPELGSPSRSTSSTTGTVLYSDTDQPGADRDRARPPDGTTGTFGGDFVTAGRDRPRPPGGSPCRRRRTTTAAAASASSTSPRRQPSATVWETCDYRSVAFSPDGRLRAGHRPLPVRQGKPSLSASSTPTPAALVASFVQERRGDQTPSLPPASPGRTDDSVRRGRRRRAGDAAILRLGVDGSIEQAVARRRGRGRRAVLPGRWTGRW